MNTAPRFTRIHGPSALAVAVFSVLVSLFACVPARASERWATLQAIHMLENPRDLATPGSFGELGAYQFRPETWRMHTLAPFESALDRRVSDAVAVKHYDYLRGQIQRRGLEPTPFRIALAWNAGLAAASSMRPPRAAVDYATRASNLAGEYHRIELATAATQGSSIASAPSAKPAASPTGRD
jgi:hypothetical protein